MNKTIQPPNIPQLLFGVEENGIKLKNTFEAAFGFERNRNIWATIGIFHFDRNCLRYNKVKHEVVTLEDGTIDVDADPLATKLLSIEELNKSAISLLDLHGLDGSACDRR